MGHWLLITIKTRTLKKHKNGWHDLKNLMVLLKIRTLKTNGVVAINTLGTYVNNMLTFTKGTPLSRTPMSTSTTMVARYGSIVSTWLGTCTPCPCK